MPQLLQQSNWGRIVKKKKKKITIVVKLFYFSSSFNCKEPHQVRCARTVDVFFCPTTARSPTLSVLSRTISPVSKEAEFPSAGQRVKISQSIRVCLPAAAETSRESIWFFSEKNKLCGAYFKKKCPVLVGFCCVDDALQTFGSGYWPRDMRVSLEAFRKHLHTFSRVWVLTMSHIDWARKTHRNHGIIELWNAVQWPQAERFPVCNKVAPWLVSLLPVEGSGASTRRTRLLAPPSDHHISVLFFFVTY